MSDKRKAAARCRLSRSIILRKRRENIVSQEYKKIQNNNNESTT